MAFVRRKRGQVLLVSSRRDGSGAVRQLTIHTFRSPEELGAVLEDGWADWCRDVRWRNPELTWHPEKVRHQLEGALESWAADAPGGLHQRRERVSRVANDLATELKGLSKAGSTDTVILDATRPLLEGLREELNRLLSPGGDLGLDGREHKEPLDMGTAGTSTFDGADHIFDQGMEHWWRGERPKACRHFRQALKVDPSHADAHTHVGIVELERGRLGAAEKHFEAAVEGGARRIASELGQVSWGLIENRPYLRALANLALVCGKLGRWADVVEIYERLLRLNPDDNQGIRWMIGEAYHRVGVLDTAVEAYQRGQEEAGCCYGLALALHQEGRDSEAGAALVRGFARNFYVPPMLLGERWSRVPGWHGTNMREPEWAADVVDRSRDLWRAAPESAELLRRWWTAEPVQRWLRDLQRVMRDLDTRPPQEDRSRLVHEQSALMSERTMRLVAGEVEPEAGGRVAPRKAMHQASPDQVRIVRTDTGATVEYADDAVGSVTYTLDDAHRQMGDEELLLWHNEHLAAVAEHRAALEYVAVEIPPGSPQIEPSEITDAWVTRGSVLRCRISSQDREPVVIVDDIALDMDELGKLLADYEGWGMRIIFVPEDELVGEPKIEVRDPKKRGSGD